MPNEQQRNRRVTDKQGGLLDAAAQAVRLERIEGDHRLLSQQVKSSLDALNSTLQNVQLEARAMSGKISDMHGLQGAHDSNNVAISEVKKSLGELDKKLQDWFDDFDTRNSRRWEIYEANRDQWRLRHEAENENSQKDIEREIRSVRETAIRSIGWGTGVAALAGIVVAGFLWNINYRFNDVTADATKDINRLEASTVLNRSLIDQMGREHGSELADIKLYLARGGRIPEEPYVPQSQRKTNGHQQAAVPVEPADTGQPGK